MNDTEAAALLTAGGGGVAGGGWAWWKRRKAKKQARLRQTALRLFPKADPQKLEREIANLMKHKRFK